MTIFLNQLKCIFLGVKNCSQSKFNKVTKINQIHLKEVTCFEVKKHTLQAAEIFWARSVSARLNVSSKTFLSN